MWRAGVRCAERYAMYEDIVTDTFLLWEMGYSTLWGRFLFSIPFIFGSLIGALVFSRRMQRRSLFLLRAAACVAVCCVVAFFLWPWASYERNRLLLIAAYVFQFILVVLSMLLCSRCSIRNAVFYAENGVAAFSIVKLLFDCVGAVTIEAGIHIRPYGAVYSILYIGIGVAVYILLYFLLRRKGYGDGVSAVDPLRLLIPTSVVLAVAIIFNINISSFIYTYSLQADIIVMMKVMLIICCVLVLLINFDVFTINRQRHEVETISQLSKKQQEQFAFSKANIEALNMKYHDLKGMIGSLRKMADQNIAASLQEAEAQLDAYDKAAKTGNPYLDVLLTERSIYCEQNGIKFTYLVEGEALSFMQPMDVVSFFDNCTGNAIEAVSALAEAEKRVISLQCSKKQGMLAIRCDNYFSGTLRMADGLPATCKKDAAEHGFGLKSMRQIVQKYGGSLAVSAAGDIFTLTAIIPCP